MPKRAALSACLWLFAGCAAVAAPEGVYRGPGYFPGYYGGYLYGYNPGPSLPVPGDERIVCTRIFIADRFIWSGNGFISAPITNNLCRAVKERQRRGQPELVLKR